MPNPNAAAAAVDANPHLPVYSAGETHPARAYEKCKYRQWRKEAKRGAGRSVEMIASVEVWIATEK